MLFAEAGCDLAAVCGRYTLTDEESRLVFLTRGRGCDIDKFSHDESSFLAVVRAASAFVNLGGPSDFL